MTGTMTAIDLEYVEKNPSRHGKIRYYVRVNGKRWGRLPDTPNTPEFTEKYWEILTSNKLLPAFSVGPSSNTFGWLCNVYRASHAWQQLDPTTQKKRLSIINGMMHEPLTGKPEDERLFEAIPLSSFTASHVEVLRDRKKDTPFAADERLKVLRMIFATKAAGGVSVCKTDPTAGVDAYRKKTDGHHTLTQAEALQYINHHGTNSKATLALMLLMYTGMRVSDLAKVGPQHRSGDVLKFRVTKGANRNPQDLVIPIHPDLESCLDLHPDKHLSYLVTAFGASFSVKGLGNRVSDWFTQAGIPHCTAHSVRKGLATLLAESEATDGMLNNLMGWRDHKTSKIYTRKAEQARIARQAVAKIKWDKVASILSTVGVATV